MKRLLIILCVMAGFIGAGSAWAEPGQIAPKTVGPLAAAPGKVVRDGVLLSRAQELRAEAIGSKLRCLVCQNESVEVSEATLARQFRGIIRRRVVKGESDKRIIDFMVQRYGIFILLKPPLIPATWLLWFSPLIALLCGGLVLIFARKRRSQPPPPLTATEEARLKELLH
jgi:cytochrome c-type biogenesis protein CcmH